MGTWLVSGLIVIAAIAAGIFLWHRTDHGSVSPQQAASTTPAVAATSAASSSSAIEHPIDRADSGPAPASTAPLPALDASDGAVADDLAGLAGGGLDALLLKDQVVRRFVATVDALPRGSVGQRILPLRTPRGAFMVDKAGAGMTIDARNAQRYAPYMQLAEKVDPQALVSWYARHYPLFQQAYRDLGYPKGYFNDRLVVAIDDMLAAPDVTTPVALVQPHVLYQFAEPNLQSLSAGQKLMIRLGPANEARLKARLRTMRSALTGSGTLPPHR